MHGNIGIVIPLIIILSEGIISDFYVIRPLLGKTTANIQSILVIWVLFSYLLVVNKDSGIIKKKNKNILLKDNPLNNNQILELKINENKLFFYKNNKNINQKYKFTNKKTIKWCKKCNNYKPPRAHHCRQCGHCILRMDHHCIWINNCVGIGNSSHFFRFILSVIIASINLLLQLFRCILKLWKFRNFSISFNLNSNLNSNIHSLVKYYFGFIFKFYSILFNLFRPPPSYISNIFNQSFNNNNYNNISQDINFYILQQIVFIFILLSITLFLFLTIGGLLYRIISNSLENITTIEQWDKSRLYSLSKRGKISFEIVKFPYNLNSPLLNLKQSWGNNFFSWLSPFHSLYPNEQNGLSYPIINSYNPDQIWPPENPLAVNPNNNRENDPFFAEFDKKHKILDDYYSRNKWISYEGEQLKDFGVDVNTEYN